MAESNEVGKSVRKENGVGVLRAKTIQQLASEYSVSRETMRKWLEPFNHEIGERIGNIFNVSQVRIIYQKLGQPE